MSPRQVHFWCRRSNHCTCRPLAWVQRTVLYRAFSQGNLGQSPILHSNAHLFVPLSLRCGMSTVCIPTFHIQYGVSSAKMPKGDPFVTPFRTSGWTASLRSPRNCARRTPVPALLIGTPTCHLQHLHSLAEPGRFGLWARPRTWTFVLAQP